MNDKNQPPNPTDELRRLEITRDEQLGQLKDPRTAHDELVDIHDNAPALRQRINELRLETTQPDEVISTESRPVVEAREKRLLDPATSFEELKRLKEIVQSYRELPPDA